jgi:hypothetical protein
MLLDVHVHPTSQSIVSCSEPSARLLTHAHLPQGINRLGKAAPRPGSLRPPDPTRNRITDHFSENVEGLESDRDYQRAVQDVSCNRSSCTYCCAMMALQLALVGRMTFICSLCRSRMRSRHRAGCLDEEVSVCDVHVAQASGTP